MYVVHGMFDSRYNNIYSSRAHDARKPFVRTKNEMDVCRRGHHPTLLQMIYIYAPSCVSLSVNDECLLHIYLHSPKISLRRNREVDVHRVQNSSEATNLGFRIIILIFSPSFTGIYIYVQGHPLSSNSIFRWPASL